MPSPKNKTPDPSRRKDDYTSIVPVRYPFLSPKFVDTPGSISTVRSAASSRVFDSPFGSSPGTPDTPASIHPSSRQPSAKRPQLQRSRDSAPLLIKTVPSQDIKQDPFFDDTAISASPVKIDDSDAESTTSSIYYDAPETINDYFFRIPKDSGTRARNRIERNGGTESPSRKPKGKKSRPELVNSSPTTPLPSPIEDPSSAPCALCTHYQSLDIKASSLTTPGICCKKLNTIIPFRIHQRLNQCLSDESITCVAHCKPKSSSKRQTDDASVDERCKRNVIVESKLHTVKARLETLQNALPAEVREQLQFRIELENADKKGAKKKGKKTTPTNPDIYDLIYCRQHKESARCDFAKLDPHLARLRDPKNTEILAKKQLNWWRDAIANPGKENFQRKSSSRQSSMTEKKKTSSSNAKEEHGFTPFQPPDTMQVPVKSALLTLLRSPLNLQDSKEGSIYLYSVMQRVKTPTGEGNETSVFTGYVKIGRTDREQEKRYNEWSACIGSDYELEVVALDSAANDARAISHVNRVESLIHRELKDKRRERKCKKNCKVDEKHVADEEVTRKGKKEHKFHQEFFLVDREEAKHCCMRWINWIQDEPYRQYGKHHHIWVIEATRAHDNILDTIESEDPADDDVGTAAHPKLVKRLTDSMNSGIKLVRRTTGEVAKQKFNGFLH